MEFKRTKNTKKRVPRDKFPDIPESAGIREIKDFVTRAKRSKDATRWQLNSRISQSVANARMPF